MSSETENLQKLKKSRMSTSETSRIFRFQMLKNQEVAENTCFNTDGAFQQIADKITHRLSDNCLSSLVAF
jgi:hypothetical protein